MGAAAPPSRLSLPPAAVPAGPSPLPAKSPSAVTPAPLRRAPLRRRRSSSSCSRCRPGRTCGRRGRSPASPPLMAAGGAAAAPPPHMVPPARPPPGAAPGSRRRRRRRAEQPLREKEKGRGKAPRRRRARHCPQRASRGPGCLRAGGTSPALPRLSPPLSGQCSGPAPPSWLPGAVPPSRPGRLASQWVFTLLPWCKINFPLLCVLASRLCLRTPHPSP